MQIFVCMTKKSSTVSHWWVQLDLPHIYLWAHLNSKFPSLSLAEQPLSCAWAAAEAWATAKAGWARLSAFWAEPQLRTRWGRLSRGVLSRWHYWRKPNFLLFLKDSLSSGSLFIEFLKWNIFAFSFDDAPVLIWSQICTVHNTSAPHTSLWPGHRLSTYLPVTYEFWISSGPIPAVTFWVWWSCAS